MPSFSNEEVLEIVERETLGYAVWTYMSANAIADRELARRWDEARIALQKVDALLKRIAQEASDPEVDQQLDDKDECIDSI